MPQSCPTQPKEVTDFYAKAAQIYADKIIAIRFDDVVENIVNTNADDLKISEYKDEFVTWMAEAGYDPRGYPEQDQFYDKIFDGLGKKFPDVDPEEVFDDLFVPPLEKRIGNYFDENKKAIASAIIEQRKTQYADIEKAINGEFELSPLILQDRLDVVGIRNAVDLSPKEFAHKAGVVIGISLLQSSGDFILKQAKASSPDPETQKRYFVDTLSDWSLGDNGHIYDDGAWKILDVVQNNFDDFLQIKGDDGTYGDYENEIESGSRRAFSNYFNKEVGTTSGIPPKSRTPFLLAKKKNQIPSTPIQPNNPPPYSTNRKKQANP